MDYQCGTHQGLGTVCLVRIEVKGKTAAGHRKPSVGWGVALGSLQWHVSLLEGQKRSEVWNVPENHKDFTEC